jgi:chemotaxis regulatin CheY-phosphate phosphatase CheZ
MNTHGRHDDETLKHELIGLFEHIQRIRKEIAAIRRPGADAGEDHFVQMSDELDAIVIATEQATNTIMENVEQMEDALDEVRSLVDDPEVLSILDRIPSHSGSIFEACAFQDITGQRISKVVNSLQFIESRVNVLIDMWGVSELTKVSVQKEAPRGEYEKYLNGPQLSGQGVSQADVDAMFGGATPAARGAPAPAEKAGV